MIDMTEKIDVYLNYCEKVVRLNVKTLKAYRCDLRQFAEWLEAHRLDFDEGAILEYLAYMNSRYAPGSVKRKIASIRAFSSYTYAKNRPNNPFSWVEIKIKEPKKLPRTIPLNDLARIVEWRAACDDPYNYTTMRNKMVAELLIATGIRISELCALDEDDFDLGNKSLRIMGKGSKERIIQIESENTLDAFALYVDALHVFRDKKDVCVDKKALFVNRFGARLTEQSARSALNRYVQSAGVSNHVTPHMFRHTFATMLLEEDVNIRYIQALLGHSSVKTTEIYTHVSSAKLREIMRCKNPRDSIVRLSISR